MAAAAGMALISSVGNVGGFMGPFLVGWIKDATGSFENGLYALAGFMLLAPVSQRSGYMRRAAVSCRPDLNPLRWSKLQLVSARG
jgi:nitrate/nitrite transporter NarK